MCSVFQDTIALGGETAGKCPLVKVGTIIYVIGLKEASCEDHGWMELDQDCTECWASVLMLNLQVELLLY